MLITFVHTAHYYNPSHLVNRHLSPYVPLLQSLQSNSTSSVSLCTLPIHSQRSCHPNSLLLVAQHTIVQCVPRPSLISFVNTSARVLSFPHTLRQLCSPVHSQHSSLSRCVSHDALLRVSVVIRQDSLYHLRSSLHPLCVPLIDRHHSLYHSSSYFHTHIVCQYLYAHALTI